MVLINQFFDINNTFFTILDYPISYLEFTGTIFNLVCVILAAKRKILNWPIGLIGVVLFGVLFYQINLYADFFEQIFYFITGVWGWYMWTRPTSKDKDKGALITTNTWRQNAYWLGGITAGSVALTYALTNIHLWLPTLFPEPASLPALDATTTVMAFAAQILMMQRKLESWYLWIIIDVIAVGLYWYKAVPFVAILYFLFLINAGYTYKVWNNARKQHVAVKDTDYIKEAV